MTIEVITAYGRILFLELVFPKFPLTPTTPIPNFLNDLYVSGVDDVSAPLCAVLENEGVKICGGGLCDSDFLNLKGVRAQGGPLTILPKYLTPKLAYFVGYFLGDGSLKDVHKSFQSFKRFDHKIKVCDEFLLQVEILQSLFRDLFGLSLPIRTERAMKGEKLYYLELTNKPLYRFLTQVFGFPAGPKTSCVHIPHIVSGASKEIKEWFIRGVFDAEGDTRAVEVGFKSQPRIKIRMKSKEFIAEFKVMFEDVFGVAASGPYFEENSACFQVEKSSSIIFLASQNLFQHPIKKWRLDKTACFLEQKIAARRGN